MKRFATIVALSAGPFLSCSCSSQDEGDARLSVLLESEDVITQGLEPGDGLENVQDGWSVEFDKYIIALGDVDLQLTEDDSVTAEASDVFATDLTSLDDGGLALWELEGLKEGRWQLHYAITASGMTRHESVSASDFEDMTDAGWSVLISGKLAQSGGMSCPPAALAEVSDEAIPDGENAAGDTCYVNESISFSWGLDVTAAFGPCEIDGVSGVTLTSGSTSTAALTIHGDHLFFNGFPEGSEGGVLRLAQWVADSDLNLDGVVTIDELQQIAPSDLAEIDDRYQLGGSPLTPLDNMHTYLRAQVMTQGHFQGEGECALGGEVPHEH